MIKSYDPNIHFGRHTVEITFMKWGYKNTVTATLNGNCTGMGVISHCHEEACEKASDEGMTLVDESGKKLECEPDDSPGDWENCIVGINIVKFEPEIKKK